MGLHCFFGLRELGLVGKNGFCEHAQAPQQREQAQDGFERMHMASLRARDFSQDVNDANAIAAWKCCNGFAVMASELRDEDGGSECPSGVGVFSILLFGIDGQHKHVGEGVELLL